MYDETDDAWADRFRAAGVVADALPRGPAYPNCELATTAAEQGQGVSLAYDAVVRGTLAAGRLVRLFGTVTLPMVIYSVAYPGARADDPTIRVFRDWIFAEAARAGRRGGPHGAGLSHAPGASRIFRNNSPTRAFRGFLTSVAVQCVQR